MDLSTLEKGCRQYSQITDFDRSYLYFRGVTQPSLDLDLPAHRQALLTWLLGWKCWQFRRSHWPLASGEIHAWHEEWSATLPGLKSDLLQLSNRELVDLSSAYDALMNRTASYRVRAGQRQRVRVGPAGSAMILFALRPRATLPWNEAIRNDFGYGKGSAAQYREFLRQAQITLADLAEQCVAQGFTLTELPQRIERPHSSLPKLLDEYHWVTVKRRKM